MPLAPRWCATRIARLQGGQNTSRSRTGVLLPTTRIGALRARGHGGARDGALGEVRPGDRAIGGGLRARAGAGEGERPGRGRGAREGADPRGRGRARRDRRGRGRRRRPGDRSSRAARPPRGAGQPGAELGVGGRGGRRADLEDQIGRVARRGTRARGGRRRTPRTRSRPRDRRRSGPGWCSRRAAGSRCAARARGSRHDLRPGRAAQGRTR